MYSPPKELYDTVLVKTSYNYYYNYYYYCTFIYLSIDVY